ncbi:MAG: cation:proton antiporter, partial [Dermatophilaceae bacterium]
VVLRIGWMFPAVALARFRLGRENVSAPYGRRETIIAGWAGMRGVVTVATALAIPLTTEAGEPFPFRDVIVLIALVTVLVTLVVQGLTLAPLVCRTGVGMLSDTHSEVAELRSKATKAALEAVRASAAERGVPQPVHRAAALQYEGYLAAQDALAEALERDEDAEGVDEDYAEALDNLLRTASEAERDIVLRARRAGEVSAEAADEVLAGVEARALRDLS